ncbi:MAG TPA: POTRA domain-containing protein [Candidatus Sulfotelmatobacter sp.]
MRSGLAQIVVFATACLLAEQMPIAQRAHAAVIPEGQDKNSCPGSSPSSEAPLSDSEVSIDNVTFSGFLQMPITDQDAIVASIIKEAHGDTLDGVVDEALERARAGWQDRGYFKVQVTGDARAITKNAADPHVALFVHVNEGPRYTLDGITFKNNRAISNTQALRALFPINDGDIFSRRKVAKGLENLRKAYGQYGYINFTSVPATTFDDENKLALLEIDVDEGKQFYISSIKVEGLEEQRRQEILNGLRIKPGQIYNSRLWELSLRKYGSIVPDCECRSSHSLHLDEQTGTIAVTLDFRPCSKD